MAQETRTTTVGMSREAAERILKVGKAKLRGVEIYVFDNAMSDLPPMKNELLAGNDFTIINMVASGIPSEFGSGWIFEIGRNPDTPTHSWFVGVESVIGKNLKRHFDKHGERALPLWVHLEWVTDGGYWLLSRPKILDAALEQAPATVPAPTTQTAPALPQTKLQTVPAPTQTAPVPAQSNNSADFEDLPF